MEVGRGYKTHWLGRSAKGCLPEGEDTVMTTERWDMPKHPTVGDRGCWHRTSGMFVAPKPRESILVMLGWGRLDRRDVHQRVRGGEWRLVGVRSQRSRRSESQAVYEPPRAPPWTAQCPR